MTTFQKVIKYLAMAFAIFLTVGIIGSVLSIVGLFSGDAVNEEIKSYKISSEITELEVKINAADFTIKQGEAFSMESNLKHLTVEDKNGVLNIKETKKFGSIYNDAKLILYIPKDSSFEKANIVTGAGKLTVEHLSADTMNFELGAGEVKIDTLIATLNADIDGGAGKLTISGGALHNLDLDMGIGQLNLTSALSGESELDLGVGESNITVSGNRDDYKLDIEKGIGSITLDGKEVSNIKDKGNGNNTIDVSGGIGSINLKFK